MRNSIYILIIIYSHTLAAGPEQFSRILNRHAKEISDIIKNTTASCIDKAWNPADLSLANEELGKISAGIASVLSEKAITLSLKRDYPNACHVLSQNLLSTGEESESKEQVCLNKLSGQCIQTETRIYPVFKYHWPKYFIEVSQKGNDPHQAFASGNLLFSANRKIANMISGLTDLQGPYSLLAKVVGVSSSIKSVTQVDMQAAPGEMTRALQAGVLIPFERLRIRANDSPDMPSHEVNIWPVGLSQTIAKNLSVCQKGGFEWKLQGVPMTCPIAMARDAWSIWDTGMLDYLNPNAIRGMMTASHPVSCIADQAASMLLESAMDANPSLGESDQASSLISNLPSSYRGLGMCSFPILNSTEAIVTQTLGLVNSFQGPWCTLWGPLVPRASTHVYKSDYGFANAALKFKMLAHDIFGLPRGSHERWSLAYPWEESPASSMLDFVKNFLPFLESLGLSTEGSVALGRSLLLMRPGDPRMLDASYSVASLAQEATNLAKEIAYLSALSAGSSLLQKTADQEAVGHQTPSEILLQYREDLRQTTDQTARLGEEPVYEKRTYCHRWGEHRGLLTKSEATLPISGLDYNGHDFSPFEKMPVASCHQEIMGHCMNRHKISKSCRRPESIFYVSIERMEIARYRKAQNPKRYVVDSPSCNYSEHKPNSKTHQRHYRCAERLREIGEDDTRDYVDTPSANDPESAVGKGSEAGKIASTVAKTLPWVGAEIARAKFEDILGRSLLPGKKRVYTIFEKISCRASDATGVPTYKSKHGIFWKWQSCESAVRYELRKYIQKHMLREICDAVFQDHLGKPFR